MGRDPARVDAVGAIGAGAALSRRRLLKVAAVAAAGWAMTPWPLRPPAAWAQSLPPLPLLTVPTLEAFADTLIPGEKRSPRDRAVAGAATGPGAVQAGAVDLIHFPAAGIGTLAPVLVTGLTARTAVWALTNGVLLDPTVAPLVSLDFAQRTSLLVGLLDGTDPDQPLWEALAAVVFLAYHTAGHLDTAQAVRDGHPGLTAIRFPHPNASGQWGFRNHSYERQLASEHPATTRRGHPA